MYLLLCDWIYQYTLNPIKWMENSWMTKTHEINLSRLHRKILIAIYTGMQIEIAVSTFWNEDDIPLHRYQMKYWNQWFHTRSNKLSRENLRAIFVSLFRTTHSNKTRGTAADVWRRVPSITINNYPSYLITITRGAVCPHSRAFWGLCRLIV